MRDTSGWTVLEIRSCGPTVARATEFRYIPARQAADLAEQRRTEQNAGSGVAGGKTDLAMIQRRSSVVDVLDAYAGSGGADADIPPKRVLR